uniref:Photosystem II reaction center Psb28 protein n=1 Tax=Chloropicon roscoffensis TaxID=1461544 RepID=A0A7S3FM04_9CHLO|mmetsp:Transcript_10859/g.33179  ORF Transcript_10859/g.33179 Transcript_10859/m.33179 type:complete len:192 (+) Transcript_10859:106-681(+)
MMLTTRTTTTTTTTRAAVCLDGARCESGGHRPRNAAFQTGRRFAAMPRIRSGSIRSAGGSSVSSIVACAAGSGESGGCVMQFVKGVDEAVVPEVKLTRSRDGSNGVATFIFQKPSIFDNDADVVAKGEITGLYMIDEEGELQTQDVVASFLDGKPSKIEARYVMKSTFQWDRFMRFMERYANENGLGFNKA